MLNGSYRNAMGKWWTGFMWLGMGQGFGFSELGNDTLGTKT